MNAAGWEKNRFSEVTSMLRPPSHTPNNNPTFMASGRVVVRNDRACPRDALNPKP